MKTEIWILKRVNRWILFTLNKFGYNFKTKNFINLKDAINDIFYFYDGTSKLNKSHWNSALHFFKTSKKYKIVEL